MTLVNEANWFDSIYGNLHALAWKVYEERRKEAGTAHKTIQIIVLTSGLIQSRSRYVSHPFDGIMIAVVQFGFKHLQVSHL